MTRSGKKNREGIFTPGYKSCTIQAGYGFERSERWYDHVPDSVLENEDYKMLWDFSVGTDPTSSS